MYIYKMSFNLDLEFGNIYEKKLVDIIPNDSYIIKEGYFPYYDVEITKDNIKTKYEVKADRCAYKTANIAIEFKCNGLPSGISKTQADYYAYYIIKPYNLFELYIIPTQIIKDKINSLEYKRTIFGGDNKSSEMYIFGLNLFDEYKINI